MHGFWNFCARGSGLGSRQQRNRTKQLRYADILCSTPPPYYVSEKKTFLDTVYCWKIKYTIGFCSNGETGRPYSHFWKWQTMCYNAVEFPGCNLSLLERAMIWRVRTDACKHDNWNHLRLSYLACRAISKEYMLDPLYRPGKQWST